MYNLYRGYLNSVSTAMTVRRRERRWTDQSRLYDSRVRPQRHSETFSRCRPTGNVSIYYQKNGKISISYSVCVGYVTL